MIHKILEESRNLFTPPLFAFIRSLIRLSIAGVFYVMDYPSIATILVVMAFVSLAATVEIAVAKRVALTIGNIVLFQKNNTPVELGDSYSLKEAFPIFTSNELGDARQKKRVFRNMLINRELVAFGETAGSEVLQEISSKDYGNIIFRILDEVFMNNNNKMEYKNVRIRPNINLLEIKNYPL